MKSGHTPPDDIMATSASSEPTWEEPKEGTVRCCSGLLYGSSHMGNFENKGYLILGSLYSGSYYLGCYIRVLYFLRPPYEHYCKGSAVPVVHGKLQPLNPSTEISNCWHSWQPMYGLEPNGYKKGRDPVNTPFQLVSILAGSRI